MCTVGSFMYTSTCSISHQTAALSPCGSQAGYEMEELYALPWARVHTYIQEADTEESLERTKL